MPEPGDLRTPPPIALRQRGQALLAARRPEEAIGVFLQAVAADPSNLQNLCQLSLAYLQAGQYPEALAAANDAAVASPTSDWPQRLRASALLKMGIAESARAAAREAVKLAPVSSDAYLMLAEAEAANHDLKEAKSAAEHARDLAPRRAAPYVTLSMVDLRARHCPEAEAQARLALSIEPENTHALNNLGLALRYQGRRREAVHYLGTASRLDPRNPLYRRNAKRAAAGFGGAGVLALLLLLWFLAGGLPFLVLGIASAVVLALLSRHGALWEALQTLVHRGRPSDDPKASPELMRQLRRDHWRLPSWFPARRHPR
ncbi:MAG: tetratricopeptide repeat protein [Actinomycetota bacterium]